ncbi:MAG TPA: tetratricopeptide repeat protein, partial [Thermoanaerobaculia bacterium]|nr:tetratricopeptide repeat protein [Thermoanaerobaculia bacterium]
MTPAKALRSRRFLPALALAAGLLACRPDEQGGTTAMSSPAPPVRIEPGQTVVRPLAAGDIHPYLVRLTAGDYVRVAAEQRGVDLVLRLYDPGDERSRDVDSSYGPREAERISTVADAAGDFTFEVQGGEGTPPGTYEIRIEEREPATVAHRQRVEAELAFQEGEALRRQGEYEGAGVRYRQALNLYRESGDRIGQADALHRLGWMQVGLDRWADAVATLRSAEALLRETGNRTGAAEALVWQGRMLGRLGHYEEASASLAQALALFRETGNVDGEATALQNQGNVRQWSGQPQEAIEHYDQALALWQQLENRAEEAQTLLSLGDLYLGRGRWPEARDHLERALRLAEEAGRRDRAAVALESLGDLDQREGRVATARQRLEQALTLYRELEHRRGQAQALNTLGTALLKSGEPAAARDRYE